MTRVADLNGAVGFVSFIRSVRLSAYKLCREIAATEINEITTK